MGKNGGRAFAFLVFVFHTETGELTRAGKRLRIPDQAARLLALLLENPGTMLSREELKATLWPQGEILDYDHSIHRVVSQLREILRDRPAKPTPVIETLPKRGYRFVAPVQEISDAETKVAPPADLPPSHLPTSLFPTPAHAATQLPENEPAMTLANARHTRWRLFWLWGLGTIILLAAASGLWLVRTRSSPSTKQLSLGILPFETNGGDSAALAESFRLNLADVLSQSPEIETRSVHSFDHIGQDETQIITRAKQLGVDALLFGKFSVADNQCQLRLELVRSSDGVHMSSFQYSGTKEELAAISDRFERDFFERLRPDHKTGNLKLARPATSKAYAAYLRGRSYLLQWTDDSLLQAVAAFREAIQEDPNYARADAGLASAYFVLSQHGTGGSSRFYLEQCRTAASQAAILDPNLAEAHAMLGQVALNQDWNFPLAEEQLHRAVDLDPNHAIYRQWLSILYSLEGKHTQSLEEIDKAHAAAPNWAPLYMTEIFLAGSAHQFDRADRAAGRLLDMMPDWSLAHEQNALNLWAEGKYLPAIAEWRRAAILDNNANRIQLEDRGAELLRTGGVPAYARLRLQAIATRKGISHEDQDFVPAEWHAYAGDWNQTLVELDQMVKDRSPSALQIGTNPAYASLHHNSQYLILLKRIGIPNP